MTIEDTDGRSRPPWSDSPKGGGRVPRLALIDDSRAFTRVWQRLLAEQAELSAFASPDGFFEAVRSGAMSLEALDAVITDLRFGGTAEDGLDFARALRRQRPSLRVFLCTSAMLVADEHRHLVDGIINKDEPLPSLRELLGEGG